MSERSTDRTPLAAIRPEARTRPWLSRGSIASVGLHAGFTAILVAFAVAFPKAKIPDPDTPAQIDIVIGTNATINGPPAAEATEPQRPPASASAPETDAADPAEPVATSQPKPAKNVTAQADASGDIPAQASPSQASPSQASPSQASPSQASPSQASPSQASPSQASPSQASPPLVATPNRTARTRPSLASASLPPPPLPMPDLPTPAPPMPNTPEIRLGDGVAAVAAEVERKIEPQRAEADIGNMPPDYPPDSAQRLERGTVVLRVFIAETGSVKRVEIVATSGSRSLDRSARDRIATWHYHPATRGGTPVPDIKTEVVRFIPE